MKLIWKRSGWAFGASRLSRRKRLGRLDFPATVSRHTGLALGAVLLAVMTCMVERAAAAGPVSNPTTVDLDAVPDLDTTKRSVPLENVVFDTFDGKFVGLPDASKERIRSLRDVIRPIYNPTYGTASGLPWLKDSDWVIGYASKGGAYAYPIKVLNYRELVNGVIDGVPILVSYCPLCGSGAVYSRELEGKTLSFGNTSALYHSDLVMYDHQSGSYWFQVPGEAIIGEMTGKRLTLLPSMTVTWEKWKRLHPNTRLLVGDGVKYFGLRHAHDPFAGYAGSLNQGRFVFPVAREKLDGRLRAGEVVITAELNSGIKAYPVRLLGERALNDRVAGRPVVIFSLGFTGSAFLATVSGKRLTFQFRDGRFVDRETGSNWSFGGRAVAGPLQGARLTPVPSRRAFWFSIARTLPGLQLYLP